MSITVQHQKEALGQAYVRAVIAKAGTIKMLSKSPSAGGDEEENTVRLLTKIDGQMRSISLHLPPDKHALACNAYRDDKEVCISGTIDKSGKYWFFTEVTEFTVI